LDSWGFCCHSVFYSVLVFRKTAIEKSLLRNAPIPFSVGC
jgi:hypothetical protein